MVFHSIDPSTGNIVAEWSPTHEDEIERRLARSVQAHGTLRSSSVEQRASWLRQLGSAFTAQREELALLATQEMGKPLGDARAEIDKCAAVCEYYADRAAEYLEPREHDGAVVRYEAIGPLLAIMPWNFPFWQVARVLAPAIALGNTIVLKHAENVLGCARKLVELTERTELPPGTLESLEVPTTVVASLLADSRIRAVTLTGSVGAGRSVAEIAGREGKKSVLELGGSDPFLVLADADLELAAEAATRSRLFNGGQACISAKRYIVDQSVHDDFVDLVRGHFDTAVVGDPTEETTTIGPMARKDLRDTLHQQVAGSLAAGAKSVVDGGPRPGPGFYYDPTLLISLDRRNATTVTEETFGPVGSVIKVDSAEEAAMVANDTEFGLGACIFTRDREHALMLSQQLEVGLVAINDIVASRPDLPFGGVKASGYGRELGIEGLREFANVKTVLG